MEGGALKALTSQDASQDKWEAETKCQEQLLQYKSLERAELFFT